MFFYSARPRALSLRRSSVAPQGTETRLARQIAELLARQTAPLEVTQDHQEKKSEKEKDYDKWERNLPIRSSSLANPPQRSTSDPRRGSKPSRYYHRRPTVTIQSDGRIIIGGYTLFLYLISNSSGISKTAFGADFVLE
ncbi:unnamed protein product [Gongylonema pulchrum]|uniref:Gelsolin-like domain-containing protein n=1 Tax=Gongylonema pulchrum TaxID=637853 RepID=A0A183EJK8_9BILA|nr:unnamed protein product [Gongylonema pulchrum]